MAKLRKPIIGYMDMFRTMMAYSHNTETGQIIPGQIYEGMRAYWIDARGSVYEWFPGVSEFVA